MSMNRDIVKKRVIEIFSTMTDAEEVSEDSELLSDLEISSMDILVLLCNVEVEFSIKIAERLMRKMVTISDVVDVVMSLI